MGTRTSVCLVAALCGLVFLTPAGCKKGKEPAGAVETRPEPPVVTPDAAPPGPVGDRERVDATGYDRRCQTADDCRIVDELPCNPCNCGSVAIAAHEAARFAEAAAAVTCGTAPQPVCGECRGFVPSCERGTCEARPEP